MSVREIPVITDENEWNELCQSEHFHVTFIDDEKLQTIRKVYETNLHVVSAMAGKIRHTIGAGIEIRFSGYKSADDETTSAIKMIYGEVAYDAYKNAELYKRVFATHNSLGEATVLDPFTLEKQLGRKPDGTRFIFIKPRMSGAAGTGGGTGTINLFSGFTAPTKRREGAPIQSPFPNPVFCWEFFGAMSSSCGQNSFTPIQSILRDEVLLRQTIKYAEDAESRASNPTVYTVTNPEKPGARSAEIDISYVGQSREMEAAKRSENMKELQASFMQLEQQSNAREAAFRKSQQVGHTDTGSFMIQNSTCDPIRAKYLTPSYHTYKDPLPAGRTIAPGPQATSPPYLIELMSKVEKFVYQLVGISAAIYGGSDSPVAVNQLVMNTLIAVVKETQTWLLPIILKLFHTSPMGRAMMEHAWKNYSLRKRVHEYIAELRRLRLEKRRELISPPQEKTETDSEKKKPRVTADGEIADTHDDEFSDIPPLPKFTQFMKQQYKVSVVFKSLIDPVSVRSWMEDNMISAATAIALTAAYSGQPEDIFDEKTTQRALDAKLKEKELKAKPPPKPAAAGGGIPKTKSDAGGTGQSKGDAKNPLSSKLSKDKDGKVTQKVDSDAAKVGSTQAAPKNGRVSSDPKKTSATTAPSSSSKKNDADDEKEKEKKKKEKGKT